MAGTRKFDEHAALDAAMRVFWTHGYEGATVARLEAATGLGRQSLYGAFGDKAAMFDRVMARYAATVAAPIRGALALEDPAEAIRAFFAAQRAACGAPGCLFAVAATELGPRKDRLGDALRAAQAAGLAEAQAAFARWRAAGRVRADLDPAAAAALLASLQQGTAALERAGPAGAADAAAAAAAEAMIAWTGARPDGADA